MSEPDQASWLDELDLDAAHSWRVMGTRSLGHRPWLSGSGDAGRDAARQLLGLRSELLRERFDILVNRRDWFEPPFQRFLHFCASAAFQRRADELGGYDVSGFGRVHFNGP